MKHGTTPDQGDLVLLPFPFTDLSGLKRRPAIVVSPPDVNRATEDRIVVAVTSKRGTSPAAGSMSLSPSDLARGKLVKPSVI